MKNLIFSPYLPTITQTTISHNAWLSQLFAFMVPNII